MPSQNRYYTNTAQGTYLANVTGISNSGTQLQVNATTGWSTNFPFVVSIEPGTDNEELVLVTSGSGTSVSPFIITRGYDNTTAVSHAANVAVIPKICQLDLAEPQQHINLSGAASGAHGLPASAWSGGQLQHIKTTTLQTSQSSFSFTSTDFALIPSGFHHIKVYAAVHTSYTTSGLEHLQVQYNNYTGAYYCDDYIYNIAPGASPSAGNESGVTSAVCGMCWTSGFGPLGIGRNEILFPYYTDSTWSKGHTFSTSASDGIGATTINGAGACNQVTAPLTSLTFTPQNGPSSQFLANCIFSLYAF